MPSDKKTNRSATPEEMARFQRDADEAERHHFGYGLAGEPTVEEKTEANKCLIVDRPQGDQD